MKWTYPGQTPEQRERQRATLADMEQRRQHFARHGLRIVSSQAVTKSWESNSISPLSIFEPVNCRCSIEIIYGGSDG